MREKPKPEKWKFYCYVICSYFLFTVNLSSIMNCFYSCTMQNLYLNNIDLNHCYIALTCRISHVRILGTFLRESKKLATKAIGSTKPVQAVLTLGRPLSLFAPARTNTVLFIIHILYLFEAGPVTFAAGICRYFIYINTWHIVPSV